MDDLAAAGGFTTIDLFDLFPASVSAHIADQPLSTRRDFATHFAVAATRAGAAGIKRLELDIGLDEMAEDGGSTNRVELIKSLAPILLTHDLALCLPVRLPSHVRGLSRRAMRFCRDTMNPNLHFTADIHPHELPRGSSPAEILRWLIFNLDVVRFVYEPEIGNHLTGSLISPWLEFLAERAFRGHIAFAPNVSSNDTLVEELDKSRALLEAIGGDRQQ